MNKSLKKIIQAAVVVIILYFVYRQIESNWDDLKQFQWHFNFGLLILSILINLGAFLLFSKIWCYLMTGFGYSIKLKDSFKISYIANLGRYIPGRIWPLFGMAYLAKQIGVKEQESVMSWVIVQIFALPAAFMVGLICFLLSPELMPDNLLGAFGLGLIILGLVLLAGSIIIVVFPNKAFLLINILLKKLKRPVIDFKLSIKTAMIIYIGYVVGWSIYGAAFWLFIKSLTGASDVPIIAAIGTFVLAYQIGYLAIITPGGLGVRELVMTTILNPYLGGISAGMSVAARLWSIITEISAALISLFIKLSHSDSEDN